MRFASMRMFVFLSLSGIIFSAQVDGQESGIVRYLNTLVSPVGGSYVSGCWGWTDTSSGREYALLGCAGGTSIVEITDPDNLVERDFIFGVTSNWREIQTHSHYAYVVSEGGGGTQIIDLSSLPDSARLVGGFVYASGLRTTARAHTIHISNGTMYLNGCAQWSPGGIVIFSLADPEHPLYLSEYPTRYVHDCFVRNDTIYAATIYAGGIDIIDVTTKTAPSLIGRFTYSGAGTHNCATTVDGHYLLTTDEVGSTSKSIKIWDLRNPLYPKVAEYVGDPSSVVHNVFVKNGMAFMSYYTAGMKVLNISDPTEPIEIGGYDTFPGASGGYVGAWSVYPFFPSGRIIIGDMVTGMYLVDMNTTAPLPPQHYHAYSDYRTPTSVAATWSDPTTLASGEPLTSFQISVLRDGEEIARVDSGVEIYLDTGLVLHQKYGYSLRTVSGLDSSRLVSREVYAGGHAQSMSPSPFTLTSDEQGIRLAWTNPTSQKDGTPLNDLAYIQIFRDGVVYDSVAVTPADTGRAMSYFDSTAGYHWYKIRAQDNEVPGYFSDFSAERFGYGGVNHSFSTSFEDGARSVFVAGTWDTVRTLAYAGDASLTDSPEGNYIENTESYILLPPVILDVGMVLRFHHIAIVRLISTALVEISINGGVTYTTLDGYSATSSPGWRDYTADPGDWVEEILDLNPFAGDTAIIRFRLHAAPGTTADGWYLDDIVVGPATNVKRFPEDVPGHSTLLQNYPNPFNPETHLSFVVVQPSFVTLDVYDLIGRHIATVVHNRLVAGEYKIPFDGSNLSGGVYLYRLEVREEGAGGTAYHEVKKMVLTK